MTSLPWQLHVFDPEAEVAIIERRLPHWGQAGAIAFLTFRTADSMPKSVLDRWHADRASWLRDHRIDPDSKNWKQALQRLGREKSCEFHDVFSNRWHDELDACHGECVLRRSELAAIVANSLHHFHGDRYLMLDFVVMPNHVHILCSFQNDETMTRQCESWKHYTAVRIHRELKASGRFWQQDGFDHLVRSEKQFQYLRLYIAGNPEKARLKPGEYLHYSNEEIA